MRLPEPLDVEPVGVCAICGEEQLKTVEVAMQSAGGVRVEVTHWLECGCGRRRMVYVR